jgi:hypothetical protein
MPNKCHSEDVVVFSAIITCGAMDDASDSDGDCNKLEREIGHHRSS